MKRINIVSWVRLLSAILTAAVLLSGSALADLKRGSTGDAVKAMQEQLIDVGALNDLADGIFGRKTEKAVKDLQKYWGMKQNGRADEDFLQEGYLGLTLALGELADMDADTYGGISMEEAVETAVRRQLAEANARQKALSEKDDRLIVQAELLKKSIDRLTEEIEELDREIGKLKGRGAEIFRKFGEENISEAQVRLRRSREHERQINGKRELREERAGMLKEAAEERERSRNRILEADHAVRLLCEKVGDHTRMRMAAYWRAALKEHRDAEGVPATPNLEISNDAERIYLSGHKEFYRLDN